MQVKKTNLIYDDRQEWRSGVKTGETVYKHGTDGMLQKVSEVQSDYSNDYDFGSDSTAIRQRYVYRSWRPYGLDDFHVPEQYKEISYITTTLSQGRRRPRLVNETVIGDNGSVTKLRHLLMTLVAMSVKRKKMLACRNIRTGLPHTPILRTRQGVYIQRCPPPE